MVSESTFGVRYYGRRKFNRAPAAAEYKGDISKAPEEVSTLESDTTVKGVKGF